MRAEARLSGARLGGMRSKRAGGKSATYARRLRTGAATNPPAKTYISAISDSQLDHLAEKLTHLEVADDEVDDGLDHEKSE